MLTRYEGDNAWIPLADAIEFVADKIYPNEDKRSARKRVRERISYAVKQRKILSRKWKKNRLVLHHQSFDRWAVKAWPDLSDVINPPKLELVHLTPERTLVSLPPTVDHTSVELPDDYDALKKLHLSVLDELLGTKWHLQKCQYELAKIARREDTIRQERVKAGKKSRGVSRPGRKR